MHEKCIQVPVVLGFGTTQHLICTEIPLKPKAFEIKDTIKRVEVTQCCVGGLVKENDKVIAKVIIDAVLKKNINFKSVKDCDDRRKDSDDDNDRDVLETRVVCGDLRHCFVEIPFCTLVEVKLKGVELKDCDLDDDRDKIIKKILEDLRCEVRKIDVVAQCVEEIRDHHDGCIDKIIEKDVVRVEVKVVRVEEIEVKADKCDLDP